MNLKFGSKTFFIFTAVVICGVTFLTFQISTIYKTARTSFLIEKQVAEKKAFIAYEKKILPAYSGKNIKILQNFSGAEDLIEFQNSLYAVNGGGLVQYSKNGEIKKHFTVLDGLPESDLVSLGVFRGKLFIGTRTAHLLEFDGKNFTQFKRKKLEFCNLPDESPKPDDCKKLFCPRKTPN